MMALMLVCRVTPDVACISQAYAAYGGFDAIKLFRDVEHNLPLSREANLLQRRIIHRNPGVALATDVRAHAPQAREADV